MGKKISWEDSEKLAAHVNNDKIILDKPNKYGYRININHPEIRPYYEHYKRKIGAIILSDAERLKFEAAVIRMLRKGEPDE